MEDVAIVGVGQSTFSRKCEVSIKELVYSAFQEAMEGLEMTNKDIDASITCSAPEYDKQRSPSGLISEYLELTPKPAFYVETVCSSSTTGLRVGWSLIKSGLHKVVAIIGFQKMSELSSREAAERMGRGADIMWESPFGITMPSGYALYAQAHMAAYGTTEEQLARVRVKNASYGARNPKATYRKELTLEDVMNSAMIATPLKLYDACANADGSSCIILASADVAKNISKKPIWVAGLGAATDTMTMSGRKSITGLACAQDAAQQAYTMAGIGPQDIDVAEVHDCFTIAEIIAYEDLNFCPTGKGGTLVESGETRLDGRLPVNTSGGLKAKGHPVGATGTAQAYEIYLQLTGQADNRQVKNAQVGLTHNVGGSGATAIVHIYRSNQP